MNFQPSCCLPQSAVKTKDGKWRATLICLMFGGGIKGLRDRLNFLNFCCWRRQRQMSQRQMSDQIKREVVPFP